MFIDKKVKMKILFTYLFVLVFICIDTLASPLKLTKEEKQYIQNNPIITIGMMSDFSVFSYIKDTKSIGFEHDLLNIISSKSGLKFEKKLNNWPLIYNEFKDKKLDMLASNSFTKYRNKFTLYTTPYYNISVMVFTRDDFGSYSGIESLKGKKLGLINNIFYVAKFKKISNVNLIYYNNNQNLVRDLVYGNIDALILNYPTVQKIIKEKNYHNIIESNPFKSNKILKEDLRFGIRSEKVILHSIIQKTLDNISEESLKALHSKWMIDDYSKPVNYSMIFLIIMSCIISVGLIFYILMKKRNKELSQLVITDKLTNLYNRRKLEEYITEEIYRSERFKRSFTLVILDIDHFKEVNDDYGHQTGDKVLIEFSNILQQELRKTDFVGRFGGEEFVLICPESNTTDILPVVEALRLKIANSNFEEIGQKTASFGLTMYKENDTITSLIKRADEALYQAKNSGRNKSIIKL